jgi:tripartite-type tricarboxylate transporter receptor subunit TctC
MSGSNLRRLTVGALALVFVATAPVVSFAAGVADFYKGKTVRVVIGYSVGGGYDTYARLLAKYLGRHIPGNPEVIAENMPGAGSVKAALYLYSAAPKDGTVIGTFGRSVPVDPLINPSHARFDATKLSWLGSVTSDVSLALSWHTSPIKTWEDVYTQEFVVGGNQAGSDPDVFALATKGIFGAKIRLVTGYPGSTDIALAMERGEVAGMFGMSYSTLASRHPEWISQHKVHILLQAALKKDPDLPNVPLIMDYAKTDMQKKLVKLLVASQAIARPFAAPGGIPADRLAALRKAFAETVADPEFLADAKTQKLDVNPTSGEEIEALLNELYATPPRLLKIAVQAFNGTPLDAAVKSAGGSE